MHKYYTDYPVFDLGDIAGEPAPFRPCEIVAYDGDKYVDVDILHGGERIRINVKSGYVYGSRSNNPRAKRRIRGALSRLIGKQENES